MSGDQRRLEGVRVLVPRAPAQAEELAGRVRALGGVPVVAPVLTIEPGDGAGLAAAASELREGEVALVCLTSPNGVDALADALAELGGDGRDLARAGMVAAVGPGTAARLERRLGVGADLIPDTATTAALGRAVPPGHGRALLPRADLANPVLSRLLAAKGYDPVEITAYRTGRPRALAPDVLDQLTAGRIDLLAFASPSTVRNFVALVGDRPWRGRVVSIGPVTSAACRELGVPVAAEARRHDLDGLIDALVTAAHQ